MAGGNFAEFDKAAKMLRSRGYEVVSPAEMDRALGYTGEQAENEKPSSLYRKHVLLMDIQTIFLHCDGVASMAGWNTSSGAILEVCAANAVDLPHRSVGEWISNSDELIQEFEKEGRSCLVQNLR
jgi:hypothetical protein